MSANKKEDTVVPSVIVTVRDYFAGQALMGLVARSPLSLQMAGLKEPEAVARAAYAVADMMLKVGSEKT